MSSTIGKPSMRQQIRTLNAALHTRNAMILAILEEAEGEVTITPEVAALMKEGKLRHKQFRLDPVDGKLENGFKIVGE